MAHIEKRRGKYRARFADPLGKIQSQTFTRRTDAERFLRELEADRVRGHWVDPRNADIPVAKWAEEFLLLCRRLSPTTQETYRRDLDGYVLPRFGGYRLGQLPADEIENWLTYARNRRPPPESSAASTICATPALPWRSRPVPTRRRSSRGWDTRRST